MESEPVRDSWEDLVPYQTADCSNKQLIKDNWEDTDPSDTSSSGELFVCLFVCLFTCLLIFIFVYSLDDSSHEAEVRYLVIGAKNNNNNNNKSKHLYGELLIATSCEIFVVPHATTNPSWVLQVS